MFCSPIAEKFHSILSGWARAPKPDTMDSLEKSVKFVESFMGAPLPVQMVTVLFADAVAPNFLGTNYGSSIAILPEHEHEREMLARTLTHEVSHYYWAGQKDWMDEGMANLIEISYSRLTQGIPLMASEYPCSFATNISELEQLDPE